MVEAFAVAGWEASTVAEAFAVEVSTGVLLAQDFAVGLGDSMAASVADGDGDGDGAGVTPTTLMAGVTHIILIVILIMVLTTIPTLITRTRMTTRRPADPHPGCPVRK